ncbi:hypothetical protein K438DRAFT_1969402 [Mycena galopus ATCC 62051]|nr:hypothetical protein K438DRAFT_1969402 [Mycena galopus ATCC 62051]
MSLLLSADVLSSFGAAIAGLVSIRAYGAQTKFNTESLSRINRYTRAARNYYNLNRWVSIHIDMLGATLSASFAAYLVYVKRSSAGDSGFLINMAVTFTQTLLCWSEQPTDSKWKHPRFKEQVKWHEIQANTTSLFYLVSSESKDISTSSTRKLLQKEDGLQHIGPQVETFGWRISQLDILKMAQRYYTIFRSMLSQETELASSVAPSSLTLPLLRCIPTEGSVTYNGLETSALNLDALRLSTTIIPQVPELLSGSLRVNLDPFGQYDDVELNYALRAAGLFALQNETDGDRITLDSAISVGGSNLSIGQRQIFALARSICLHRMHCLILSKQRRLLSLVLDAGRIVEFDSPKELLKIRDGKLCALVDESGDREI